MSELCSCDENIKQHLYQHQCSTTEKPYYFSIDDLQSLCVHRNVVCTGRSYRVCPKVYQKLRRLQSHSPKKKLKKEFDDEYELNPSSFQNICSNKLHDNHGNRKEYNNLKWRQKYRRLNEIASVIIAECYVDEDMGLCSPKNIKKNRRIANNVMNIFSCSIFTRKKNYK